MSALFPVVRPVFRPVHWPAVMTQTGGGDTPTVTVATTGGAGEIVFDPIVALDAWTATTGGAGEIILEAA